MASVPQQLQAQRSFERRRPARLQYDSGRGSGLTEGLAHLLDRYRAAAGLALRVLRLEVMLVLVRDLQARLSAHPPSPLHAPPPSSPLRLLDFEPSFHWSVVSLSCSAACHMLPQHKLVRLKARGETCEPVPGTVERGRCGTLDKATGS